MRRRDLRAALLRGRAAGRSWDDSEPLHLAVDLYSQVNRCGCTVEDRGFIFSLGDRLERRLDQQGVPADDFFLDDVPVLVDDCVNDDGSMNVRLARRQNRIDRGRAEDQSAAV